MAGHEAGVQVTCAGCGQVVMHKSMIPLLGDGGQGIRYLCPACARGLGAPEAEPAAIAGAGAASPEAEPVAQAEAEAEVGR